MLPHGQLEFVFFKCFWMACQQILKHPELERQKLRAEQLGVELEQAFKHRVYCAGLRRFGAGRPSAWLGTGLRSGRLDCIIHRWVKIGFKGLTAAAARQKWQEMFDIIAA